MIYPKYSVILLTKNAGGVFSEVLDRLFECEGINEGEVIMIDSGSTDLTLEYARKYSDIRLFKIHPSDYGHGKTRNMGAGLAKGDFIIYLVQDAIPANSNFLKELMRPLTNINVAGVYGRQIPRASVDPIEGFFLKATYPETPQIRTYSGVAPMKIDSLFFSNVASALKRAVWKKIPFNENLIMSEDQQWAKNALQAGYCILYQPTAMVNHSHNYGLKETFQRNFDSGFSLRGLVDDTLRQMVCYEMNYLLAGIKQLTLWGNTRRVPYFLLKEALRSLGFFLGQKSNLFPLRINRRLSMHKFYWDRYEKAGL